MLITSLRVRPVARVFAIFYAAFSPFIAISMLLSGADYLRIPLGLVAPPLTYLNINFNIQCDCRACECLISRFHAP